MREAIQHIGLLLSTGRQLSEEGGTLLPLTAGEKFAAYPATQEAPLCSFIRLNGLRHLQNACKKSFAQQREIRASFSFSITTTQQVATDI